MDDYIRDSMLHLLRHDPEIHDAVMHAISAHQRRKAEENSMDDMNFWRPGDSTPKSPVGDDIG